MYKVLIVEDEYMMRDFIKSFIDWKKIGFEIVGAVENGCKALDFINNEMVDVILTDIRMPIMDGIELSRVVREKYPSIHIVLMTAYNEFEYARSCIQIGIDEYLLKSDDEDMVIKCFNRLKLKLSEKPSNADKNANNNIHPILCECMEYIDNNYNNHITLTDLEDHVHIHQKHISRLFSKEFHKTFLEILTEKRINAAKIYLSNTKMRIFEIADLIGYNTPAYFTKVFRDNTSMSPNEYRRKTREER